MTEPAILFVPPGTVTDEDRATLREAGVVVVQMEDPRSARLVRPSSELNATEMLMCAGGAILTSTTAMEVFGKKLATLLANKQPNGG